MKLQYVAVRTVEMEYSIDLYGPLQDGETEEMCVMRVEQVNKLDMFEFAFSNGEIPAEDVTIQML